MNHEKRKVSFILNDGHPLIAKKVSRDSPCTCGSGKKQKHCHGAKTEYYNPNKEKES